ncbi:MAG: 16S rRNA pseudouridine(516) synthase [Thomasclavelia sp.]|nr:16S rRNA pseudouridine(516) synthase [Thomasclavelia sp.]
MQIRLDKYLSKYGLGSRKDVKKIIKKKLVKVNNDIIIKDNYKLDTNIDKVYLNDELIAFKEFVYLMLNKPKDVVCATKDNAHDTVIDLIQDYDNYDLFPVGRLDKDTEGLLILTNDGEFAHNLLAPKRHHSKIYKAIVDGKINNEDIEVFKKGIILDGKLTQSSNLTVLSNEDDSSIVEVEIFEGKFHQIKRMFHYIGKEVLYLKRISIKGLNLDENLSLGEYRELTEQELELLKKDL